jgi:hypothetical protein
MIEIQQHATYWEGMGGKLVTKLHNQLREGGLRARLAIISKAQAISASLGQASSEVHGCGLGFKRSSANKKFYSRSNNFVRIRGQSSDP